MSELEPTRTCSNPTETEVLRRMLDERGVEYETDDTQVSDTEWYYVTRLRDGCHDRWIYEEPPDCDLLVSYQYDLGAEDAIAATLGATDARPTQEESSETCHIKPWKMEHDTGFFDCMECSECGYVTDVSEWANATYCAGCGRRIEQ